MRRRDFIRGIVGWTAAWSLPARAQQAERVRRVGILMPYAKGDAENENAVQRSTLDFGDHPLPTSMRKSSA